MMSRLPVKLKLTQGLLLYNGKLLSVANFFLLKYLDISPTSTYVYMVLDLRT